MSVAFIDLVSSFRISGGDESKAQLCTASNQEVVRPSLNRFDDDEMVGSTYKASTLKMKSRSPVRILRT